MSQMEREVSQNVDKAKSGIVGLDAVLPPETLLTGEQRHSLNGYQAAMPEQDTLVLHVPELLQYPNRRGCATFLPVAQRGLVGALQTPVDITNLADTIVLLRYFEARGRGRRAGGKQPRLQAVPR